MNIGERLRERRKELNLSVDDIANKLNKNRATIYRYESNDIENLPVTILEPLAKVLQTTPTYLLGLEDTKNELSKEENSLIDKYRYLDDKGQHTVNTVLDMEYSRCKNEKEHIIKAMPIEPITLAAHDKEGIDKNSDTYEEDNKHDLDLMMNDDEWK